MFDPVPIIWFKPVDDFKVEPTVMIQQVPN